MAAIGTAPTVTLTAPTTGTFVATGTAVALAAAASDADGFISNATGGGVTFYVDGDPIANDLIAPYTANWTPTTAKTYSLRAQTVDDKGNVVMSAPITVTAVAAMPTVVLSSPPSSAIVATAVTLTANATASPGATVTQVAFFANGVAIGAPATVSPYSVAWTPTVAVATALTAQVTDSAGITTVSNTANVSVTAAPISSITLSAPSSGTIVTQNSQIFLRAAPSFVGTIAARVEYFVDAVSVGSATQSPFNLAYTVTVAPGAHTLFARGYATDGVTTVDSVTIPFTVIAAVGTAPTVSLTSPVAGAFVTSGSSVALTAVASDADGFISNVSGGGVTFYVDGDPVGTDLIAPYTGSWIPTTAKTYSLRAQTVDDKGNVVISAPVTVTAVAALPTVSLSLPPSTATVATAVTLTANATASPGATITQVVFFANGVAIGAPATVSPYSVAWTPTVAAATALTAQVTDSAGITTVSNAANVSVTAAPVSSITLSAPSSGTIVTQNSQIFLRAAPSFVDTIAARVEYFIDAVSVGSVTQSPYNLSYTVTVAPGAHTLFARGYATDGVTTVDSVTIPFTVIAAVGTAPTVSLTSPVAGAFVTSGTVVALTAVASDADGFISNVSGGGVTFYVDGDPVGTDLTAPYTTNWTPTTAKSYSLRAQATDDKGNIVLSAPITVTATTGLPTVTLSSPPTSATTGTAVTLTASASATGGATIAQVTFFANGNQIGAPASAFPYSVLWNPSSTGVVALTAKVTDSNNVTAFSAASNVTVSAGTSGGLSVSLAVSPAGSTIPVNSARSLTATASSTAGIALVHFYYDNTLIGSDSTAPYSMVFTAPNEIGAHTLRARAIDNLGVDVYSTAVPINIINQVGEAPLVGIGTPTSGAFLAANVATTITGTATDNDSGIASVQVLVNGATTGLANGGNATLSGSTWSINWTPSGSGTASISAIASDTSGNAVAAPSVGVNITDNLSPTVTLSLSPRTSAATASTTLPSGAIRNLVATATASSGRAVVRVEFFVDGTKVGEDTSDPYTLRYTAPALGTGELSHPYILSARAMDNAGAARDAQLSLLVVSPIGAPPTVNLLTPANGASTVPGTAVSLAATANSLDGTISSVQFFVNGSPAGINGGNGIVSAPYVSSYTPAVPGAYTIDAIATDNRGNTAESTAVTITAAFATPTIVFTSPNPNAAARGTPGVPLTLSAAATVQTGTGAAILLVEFLLDGVQIGADTAAPYSYSWIPTTDQLGAHILTARVTDTYSQIATSAPLTVNVANVVGSPPTVSVSATPIPAVFGLQTVSTVNFQATAVATGAGSSLRSVEIFLNDVSIGLAGREQTTNFYRRAFDLSRFDFTTVTPIINDVTGAVTYPVRLYAIARDSNNNQTVSATVNLVINPATSSPPTIQLQALTPTNITAGTQFFMQANLSDLDGDVTTIQLYANGVAAGTYINPQQGQLLTYNSNTAGRFNLYAVATDDTGNTAVSSPSIVINVTAVTAPTTALTRPTDNATTTTVGAPVFLEGTAVNTVTTQVPTLQFIATAAGGARQVINGSRVSTTTSYRAIWTPVNPDTYTITTQASVGSVQGTSANSRRVVASDIVGLAPTITLTRAVNVSGFPSNATTASTADFAATAADPDGAVVGVEFFLNRYSIGQARRDPQGNTWRTTAAFAGLQPGGNEIVALARDSSGNVVASTTSSINVTAASSIAPSITITPSTTNPAYNRQVQLRANARDTDGTVNSVQYFANATAIATSTNSGSLFLSNWTPTVSGTYYLWAVATDNSGITTVSPTVELTVRRNNPVLENAAFILQTYQDIANTTTINPLVFDQLDEQLGSGALSRAELIVSPLTANGGVALTALSGFQAPIQLLATYYVLMGQWPTPQNYTTFLATARTSLSNAVGSILSANEYFAKYGVVPTATLLNNVNGALPAKMFLDRLWANAGSRPTIIDPKSSDTIDLVRFMNNNVASATIGRGYGPAGLNTAIAEFVTNTNSTNTALYARARAAALFYQLTRPPVTVTVDEITARIDALLKLPDDKAIAAAVLNDVLYGYRFVTITTQPRSLVVAPRSGAIFTVEAQGAPPLVYQWLLNGAPIPGATSPMLSLTNVDPTRVGTYSVSITSAAGVDVSDAATLTLSNVATRLANISTRGVTSGGANVLIGGFVVTGTAAQTRQMLVRVIGPTLANAPFNVAGTLPNPSLELYAGSNRNPVLTNDDWGTQAAGAAQVTAIVQATNRAGAFTLAQNSRDAVVLATLPPGAYTVMATIPANTPNASGVVLIEVYDVTQGGGAGPKAINVSTRGLVGTGSNTLIAGFVINGAVSRRMLIRGAGPTLASLGVPGVLADPQISLVDQETGKVIRTNDNWASDLDAAIIRSAANGASAFPFPNNSKDAAMILMLEPGAYTVQLSGVGGTTGVGIVEVYDVDP